MATLVSTPLRSTTLGIISGYRSAVLSGITPDQRHLNRGGYHCSVEDLRRFGNEDDYSNVRPDDRNFNVKYGAAYDITMNTADMKRAFQRIFAVWKDRTDPRRRYINCINCWSGTGDAVRLDFVANVIKWASPDHKWHIHGEFRRRWATDAKAARAVQSMLAGESRKDWTAREEPAPAKPSKTGGTPAKPPAKPKPKPPAKPATTHRVGSRQLRYVPGKPPMQGDDVAFVQRFIGPARCGKADGIYGARTRAAVKWYQSMRGLRADGICGADTFRAMGVKNNL